MPLQPPAIGPPTQPYIPPANQPNAPRITPDIGPAREGGPEVDWPPSRRPSQPNPFPSKPDYLA
jgi:hypothetical protein